MSRLSRNDLDEFEVYVSRVAAFTGIPAKHIEKDFWVTEVLRGVATASRNVDYVPSWVAKAGPSKRPRWLLSNALECSSPRALLVQRA